MPASSITTDLKLNPSISSGLSAEKNCTRNLSVPYKSIYSSLNIGRCGILLNFRNLRKSGIAVEGYQFTSQSKKALIDRLIVSIEGKKILLPNWDTMKNELDNYEYEVTSAGNIRTNAPNGMHDDIVISIALYNWQVNNGVSGGDAISRISTGGDTLSAGMNW